MPTRLFALGSNGAGQLGIGHQDDVSIPEQCFLDAAAPLAEDETIAAIRAGGNHTLVLTSHGRVFATGCSGAVPTEGADLKIFQLLDIKKVFKLPSTPKVTNIAAAWNTSYFVIDGHAVYACGTGNKGELGLGEDLAVATLPELVIDLGIHGDGRVTIQDIAAGLGHVVLITSGGEGYGWGTSRKGELGEDAKDMKTICRPWKINFSFHASSVVAGRNFTFIRGRENDQLLLGNQKPVSSSDTLKLSTNTEVSCGWSNIYALDSGELHAIGRKDRVQVPLVNLPELTRFAAGSEHGVGCTVDSKVIAFGWGEHGNCGEPIDGRGNVAGRFNTIAIPRNDDESVNLIAAGCATTFVAVTSPISPG